MLQHCSAVPELGRGEQPDIGRARTAHFAVGNITMSTGSEGKKEQRSLASFFDTAPAPTPALHSPLRTPGSSGQVDAQKAVATVVTQFFGQLWGTLNSRPVGALSANRKERERAMKVLSESFAQSYCVKHTEARSSVSEGKDNQRKLLDQVHVQEWWNSNGGGRGEGEAEA